MRATTVILIGLLALYICVTVAAEVPASGPASGPASQAAELFMYNRTGGFAGTNDTMKVSADGAVTLSGKLFGSHTAKLDKADLDRLLAALKEAGIDKDAAYKPARPIADGFHHKLTTSGRTVTWEDTAALPAGLERLAKFLHEIVATAQKAQ